MVKERNHVGGQDIEQIAYVGPERKTHVFEN